MNRGLLLSVALMFVAMSLIPMGDTAAKLLTTEHGVAPFFVAFSRFGVGALMILAFAGFRVEWRLYRDWRVWLRAGFVAGGIACMVTALRTEPMATVFGAFFVGPIFSYVLSVLLLGERVTRFQTVFLMAGFGGVLLVVQPGTGGVGLWIAVLAGLFYGSYLTMSRYLSDLAPPRQLMLTQTALGTLLLAPLGAWQVPEFHATVTALVIFSGVASASGNLLLVVAYRRADATVLAPFVYFQLISATMLGWTVFGTFPNPLALTGLAILMAAGIGTVLLKR
ncbi:DMT family transporter [Jannaschia seohaensis]|uniref:Threonine/homoserine efflux transporter RhtA n=1 Tax=Jannaschia seohaensis TaxID=475081 RepID=A0A2Y9C810_9RHOB|nr:DMT family transporter [Jannaschia seohaensis]PWJ17400.1 threonine/homoserine efflux transporter RhtA [Jannaschia seohaensis]SSA47463.1 Threonine/homoserine efflux transporter RhtA [Jannaschia seohaensis]